MDGNWWDKEEKEPEVKIKREHQDIKVYIQKHCWTKMFGWCRAAESEVSGLGMAKIREDGIIEVYDVFFPRQKCTSGYTELDDDAVAKLSFKLFKQKKDQNHFRFWWHTHYNFSTFWSGIDDNNAIGLMKANGEWELSLVINQNGDCLCRLDMQKPVRATFDELPVYLISNDRPTGRIRPSRFKRDVKKYVKPFVHQVSKDITPSKYTWPSYRGVEHYRDWERHFGEAERFNWYEKYHAGDRKQLEFDKKDSTPIEKTSIKGKDAIEFGTKYVMYNGKLMTTDKLKTLEECPCQHEVTTWEACTCWIACDYCMEELLIKEQTEARSEAINGREIH